MKRIVTGMLLAALATAGVAQQRAPVFADPTGKAPSPPPQKPARFSDGNPERLTADQQRCRNLDQQLARTEQNIREAKTTGSADQLAQQRQKLLEQRSRAGC